MAASPSATTHARMEKGGGFPQPKKPTTTLPFRQWKTTTKKRAALERPGETRLVGDNRDPMQAKEEKERRVYLLPTAECGAPVSFCYECSGRSIRSLLEGNHVSRPCSSTGQGGGGSAPIGRWVWDALAILRPARYRRCRLAA